MEELFLHALSNVGVPAAICFYTLFRVNQTLRDLTDAINKLTVDVDRRLEKVEGDLKGLNHEVRTRLTDSLDRLDTDLKTRVTKLEEAVAALQSR